MNSAVVGVMRNGDHKLPAAHHDAALMTGLATDVQRDTGFENFGIPFCMTVEAESLGSEIDFGSLECEPKIAVEQFQSVRTVDFRPDGAIGNSVRARTVISAVASLTKHAPDVPVIGSITGPLSTTASIVDPMTFLKELRRDKEGSHRVLDYVCRQIEHYAGLIADNGADIVSIADPTATGEILGPKVFGDFVVPYLNRITDAIRDMGVPVIIHICGDVRPIKSELSKLRCNAISVDAMVNLGALKKELRGVATMGNLSTYLLEFGDRDKVYKSARTLVKKGIDIMAPACGLSTSTSVENIRAFTSAVKGDE